MAFINVKFTRKENYEEFNCAPGTVMKVPFEDYVAAVVASEIGNSDIEACKAQAIAARTFAVNKGVLNGKTISDSSSSDQAFRTTRLDDDLYPNAVRGAEMTSGKILTYNDKPIAAVYSACNGGHTVSAKERWGSERKYLPAQVDPWDNSTKRTGHGVGMSQRGAKAMAKAGKTYEEILAFYYPGTKIAPIDFTKPAISINQVVEEICSGDKIVFSHVMPKDEFLAVCKPLSKEGESLVNAKDFIDKVRIAVIDNWGYIYGTWYTFWTKEDQARLNKTTDSNRAKSRQYGSRWIGHVVTDCSGLVYWAMKQFGVEVAHHATYLYTDYCRNKGKLVNGKPTDGHKLLPGSLVFKKGSKDKIHHVGIYVGNDQVIEAKGAQYGVIESYVTDGWDYWGELKAVDYSNRQEKEETNMDAAKVYNTKTDAVNMRKNPRKNAGILCKIPDDAIVSVIDRSVPGWYQVEYAGRVGWVMSDYLMDVKQEPEPVQEEMDLTTLVQLMRASLEGLSEELTKLEEIVNKTVG